MAQGSQSEPASLGMKRMLQEQRAKATRRLRVAALKARTDRASAGSRVKSCLFKPGHVRIGTDYSGNRPCFMFDDRLEQGYFTII